MGNVTRACHDGKEYDVSKDREVEGWYFNSVGRGAVTLARCSLGRHLPHFGIRFWYSHFR